MQDINTLIDQLMDALTGKEVAISPKKIYLRDIALTNIPNWEAGLLEALIELEKATKIEISDEEIEKIRNIYKREGETQARQEILKIVDEGAK